MCFMIFLCVLAQQIVAQDGEFCGAPHCSCYPEISMIDCSYRNHQDYPIFTNYWQMSSVGIYLNNNQLPKVPTNYFDNWISLKILNLQNNNDDMCSSLNNIPHWVKIVLTDCNSTKWTTPTLTTKAKEGGFLIYFCLSHFNNVLRHCEFNINKIKFFFLLNYIFIVYSETTLLTTEGHILQSTEGSMTTESTYGPSDSTPIDYVNSPTPVSFEMTTSNSGEQTTTADLDKHTTNNAQSYPTTGQSYPTYLTTIENSNTTTASPPNVVIVPWITIISSISVFIIFVLICLGGLFIYKKRCRTINNGFEYERGSNIVIDFEDIPMTTIFRLGDYTTTESSF